MRKANIKEAKKHLAKIRELVAKNPTPIFRLKNTEQVVEALRETREKLWQEKMKKPWENKLASRH